jgi:hypothetical protein
VIAINVFVPVTNFFSISEKAAFSGIVAGHDFGFEV